MGQYGIKDGYVHRTECRDFDDRPNTDSCQDQVYARIHAFRGSEELRSILGIVLEADVVSERDQYVICRAQP